MAILLAVCLDGGGLVRWMPSKLPGAGSIPAASTKAYITVQHPVIEVKG